MAEDLTPQANEEFLEGSESKSDVIEDSQKNDGLARSEHNQEQRAVGAKGILQEAIRKVMEEIEHHENEAKKHLQQAAQLRKDLRESIAFLQEQGEKGQRPSTNKNVGLVKAGSPPKEDMTGALPAAGGKRARRKRK